MLPLLGTELMGVAALGLASACSGVSKSGLVQSGSCIAFELSADGGRATQELSRYSCKANALSFERVDLISFVLGQVCVGHCAR